MIRSDEEYRAAVAELRRDERIAREQEKLLSDFGLKGDQVAQALAPIRAQTERLRKDVAAYERRRDTAR